MRWTPVFAAAAVVSIALAETTVREAVSELSRPDGAPERDARGNLSGRGFQLHLGGARVASGTLPQL